MVNIFPYDIGWNLCCLVQIPIRCYVKCVCAIIHEMTDLEQIQQEFGISSVCDILICSQAIFKSLTSYNVKGLEVKVIYFASGRL